MPTADLPNFTLESEADYASLIDGADVTAARLTAHTNSRTVALESRE